MEFWPNQNKGDLIKIFIRVTIYIPHIMSENYILDKWFLMGREG